MTDHATRARELYATIRGRLIYPSNAEDEKAAAIELIAAALDQAAQEAVTVCGWNRHGIKFEAIGCGKPIERFEDKYRCVDCSTPFHRHCLHKHCEDERSILKAALQAAQEAVTELGDLRLRLNCPMVAPSCLVCGQQKELVIRHLEASAIGVCGDCRNAAQAAQPVWTKEKPTKEGWYWWRSGDIVGIHVLEFDGDEGGELVCMTTDGDTIEEMGGEWAGPLPEPREATCQK